MYLTATTVGTKSDFKKLKINAMQKNEFTVKICSC